MYGLRSVGTDCWTDTLIRILLLVGPIAPTRNQQLKVSFGVNAFLDGYEWPPPPPTENEVHHRN